MNITSTRNTGRYYRLARRAAGRDNRLGRAALGALAAVAFGASITVAAPASAADPLGKCDDFVAKSLKSITTTTGGWTSVIVKTDGAMTPDREKSITSLGGDIYRHLDLIESVAVRVPTRSLSKLVALTFVKRVSLDAAISKNDEFTVDHSVTTDAVNYYGVTGNGVGVAVVDSGVKGIHPDFWTTTNTSTLQQFVNSGYTMAVPNRIVAARDFSGSGTTDDVCGHGTHVAGIIAGNGQTSDPSFSFRTFYGIARKANIISAKVLDGNGQGTVSGVIAGISWVIQNKALYNVRVMNLSLGHPIGESYTTDPLCQAVESAYRAGIVVVTAAGNSGRLNASSLAGAANEGYGKNYGSIQSPGNDPFVITVGAMKSMNGTRASDRIATYSSRGPSRIDQVLKPDLVAPGNKVISTMAYYSNLATAYGATNALPTSAYMYAAYQSNSTSTGGSMSYYTLSGTSMASPVVAGAVALMLERNPSLTPDTVKARLMITADKWTNPNGTWDPCTYGAGYVNVKAALNSGASATRAATSPVLVRDLAGHVVVDPSQVIWGNVGGQQVIWGVNGVQNTQVIWGNAIVQSNQILWGNSIGGLLGGTVSASQVLWGNIVADPTDLLSAASTTIWDQTPVDRVIWGNSAGVDLTSTALSGD